MKTLVFQELPKEEQEDIERSIDAALARDYFEESIDKALEMDSPGYYLKVAVTFGGSAAKRFFIDIPITLGKHKRALQQIYMSLEKYKEKHNCYDIDLESFPLPKHRRWKYKHDSWYLSNENSTDLDRDWYKALEKAAAARGRDACFARSTLDGRLRLTLASSRLPIQKIFFEKNMGDMPWD